jgi:acyl-CoA thioesterase-1
MVSMQGQYGVSRGGVQRGMRNFLGLRNIAAFWAVLVMVAFAAPGTGGMAYGQGVTGGAGDAAKPVRVAVLGDSLSAGFGLAARDAFPVKLAAALQAKGIKVEMTNAGVSGDTASAGRDRLDWSIPEGVEAVIVELGANDALRGVDPDITRSALDEILTRLKAKKIMVLFCGMQAPPNMGADFAARFNALYPELAAKHQVALYPFFLDGVAANAALNQRDGIHPNADGVDVIVARILPQVEALLSTARREAH